MMKYLFILSSFTLIVACNSKTSTTANDTSGLLKIVKDKNPAAQNFTVDTQDSKIFVDYDNGKNECQSQFDIKGNYQLTYIFYDFNELPASIIAYIDKNFPESNPSMSYYQDSLGIKTYHTDFITSTEFVNIKFDEKGNVLDIKKEKLSPEEMKQQEEEGVEESDPSVE